MQTTTLFDNDKFRTVSSWDAISDNTISSVRRQAFALRSTGSGGFIGSFQGTETDREVRAV